MAIGRFRAVAAVGGARLGRPARRGLVLRSTAASASRGTVRRPSPRTRLAVQIASLLVLVAPAEAQGTVCSNSQYSGLCDGTFTGTTVYAAPATPPRSHGRVDSSH